MAVTLSAKAVGAIQMYSWKPDLATGDNILSFVLNPTTVEIEASKEDRGAIELFVSGGISGNVHPIAATVNTSFGETLEETLYVPVYGPGNAFSDTAEDVIDFALRPVVGIGETATSDEKNDALEWLNNMLASWRDQGADVGATLPLSLNDVLYVSDAFLLAVKNNLRVLVAEQYGRQVAPVTATLAMRGLQQIKQSQIPEDYVRVRYF